MKRLAGGLLVLIAVLSGLLYWRVRSREESNAPPGGAGEIEGTEVDLSSRITARILEQHVRKGAQVKTGDVLVVLDCADARAALNEAEARLAAANAQAAASEASIEASKRSKEAASAAEAAARAQAEGLAAQRDATERQAKRLEKLGSDVPFSSRDQTRASADGLVHQTAAAVAQVAASTEQARAALVGIRASEAQAVAAEAQVRAGQASVERARLLADECTVRAPLEAVVDDLPHEPGELVGAGQMLVKLVDLREVKATFYLPNAELAAAHPGGKAHVVADAWPDSVFDGVVRTVGAEAEFTPRNIQTRTDRDRLVYAIEVAVANPERKLRPGMPVQVALVTGAAPQ
jgi:HlyD family secretion protein